METILRFCVEDVIESYFGHIRGLLIIVLKTVKPQACNVAVSFLQVHLDISSFQKDLRIFER